MKKVKIYMVIVVFILLLTTAGTVGAIHINQGCYTFGQCHYCHFIMFNDNGAVIYSSFWSYGYDCGAQD